jgi:hypothetical protein
MGRAWARVIHEAGAPPAQAQELSLHTELATTSMHWHDLDALARAT